MNTFHVQLLNQEQNPRNVIEMDPSWFGHLIFDNPHRNVVTWHDCMYVHCT
jgi:hypothetical protein